MSALGSPQSESRHRRSSQSQVRAIEYARRALAPSDSSAPSSYARYVGRVGALAIALGVGSAVHL